MFTRAFNDQGDTIEVVATGVWSRDEIDRHYDALEHMIDQLRTVGQPVRVLIDMTESERQAPEVEGYVRAKVDRIYRAGDKVAVLVAGEDKQYMRTTLADADVATFSSRLPAEMWLFVPSLKKPG